MIFRFNKAQLGRDLDAKLNGLLNELQKGTETEIEVWPLEFPVKFSIKVGDDITVVVWDAEDDSYKIMPSPEPEPESESKKDTVDLPSPETLTEPEPTPEPESSLRTFGYLDLAGKFTPEPDECCITDPIELAELKYTLMSTHLSMPLEQKIIFAKEYARLWSEHK